MYRCNCCGIEFDEPIIMRRRENLDGERGWWIHTEAKCPICGEPYFEEVREDEA